MVDIPSTKQLWLRKSNKATDKYPWIFMMVWRRTEEGTKKRKRRSWRERRKRKKKGGRRKWEERQRRNIPVSGREYHV